MDELETRPLHVVFDLPQHPPTLPFFYVTAWVFFIEYEGYRPVAVEADVYLFQVEKTTI